MQIKTVSPKLNDLVEPPIKDAKQLLTLVERYLRKQIPNYKDFKMISWI